MTKLLLALSAASLCALNVHAKQNAKNQLEKINAARTAGKTTGIESRLIGLASWYYESGAMTPGDSTYMSYSPNNGWDHVQGDWKFDVATDMSHDGSSYENGIRYKNTLDAQKRIVEQLAEEWDGGAWTPVRKTVYTYSAFGTIATQEFQHFDGTNWKPSFKLINIFDAQGRIVENINQDANTGTLINSTRVVTTYNAQGLQTDRTAYTWDAGASQWNESYRAKFNYNGTQLASVVSELKAGTWTKSDSTIMKYDNNGRLIEEENHRYTGSSWSPNYKTAYAYDGNGNQISQTNIFSTNGTWVTEWQTTSTFNSFGQPLTETSKTWDDASNSFVFEDGDGIDYYYYEQFSNSVKDAAVAAGAMRVHPMPASNKLNLNLKWKDAQTAIVVLFDMTGKVTGQWSTPAATQHMQTLDISNIPAGTYMLKIMGTKGTLSQQVNIVK